MHIFYFVYLCYAVCILSRQMIFQWFLFSYFWYFPPLFNSTIYPQHAYILSSQALEADNLDMEIDLSNLGTVNTMFAALFIFLIMPIADTSRIRGNQFRPLNKFFFWVQVVVFGLLLWIGSQHPVQPFVLIGQIATSLYFAWFIIFVPIIGIIENSLFDVALSNNNKN